MTIALQHKRESIDTSVILKHLKVYADTANEFIDNPLTEIIQYKLNPIGNCPLSMLVGLKTIAPTRISVRVHGKHGPQGDICHDYADSPLETQHIFPVYGLYPGREGNTYKNKVTITATGEDGYFKEFTIWPVTPSLPEDFGVITVDIVARLDRLDNNLYYMLAQDTRPNNTPWSYPCAVDYEGEVRWLIDERESPDGIYVNGAFNMIKLRNGRLLIQYKDTYGLVELDQLGRYYKITETPFTVHHGIAATEDGRLLLQSSNYSENPETIFDELVIWDYATGEVLKDISFRPVLDESRPIQPMTQAGDLPDWLHENSVDYDNASNVYITSSRHQNIVFATDQDTNELRWMLGSHEGWPQRFDPYLLTPVDGAGNPLFDFSRPEDVKEAGLHFWNWAQHSAIVLPDDGNPDTVDILLFNNGCFRSYQEENWVVPYQNWSNVQQFKINHRLMTVRLVLDYGKILSSDYYSGYVGNVQYYPEIDNIMVNFGGCNKDLRTGRNMGIFGDVPVEGFTLEDYFTAPLQEFNRVVEIDRATQTPLYGFTHSAAVGQQRNKLYKCLKTGLYDTAVDVNSI